jgi:hypothetical protein
VSDQKVSVGRMVHYVSYGTPGGEYASECRAAIVTEVDPQHDGGVGLCVLNPTGQFFNRGVEYAEGDGGSNSNMCDGDRHPGGTWHWPARV